MFADNVRDQFVPDVIVPLCEKYNKREHEGYQVFNDAYTEHRKRHGSFAHVENREQRMRERVAFMMVTFFEWLYADQDEGVENRPSQTPQNRPAASSRAQPRNPSVPSEPV